MNIAEFLRTPFLKNIWERLLLLNALGILEKSYIRPLHLSLPLSPVSGGIIPESLSLRCLTLRNSVLKITRIKSHQKAESTKLICTNAVV